MLRLATPGYLRFNQAKQFEATFGGGEANVAVSLANYGLEAEFVTRFPKNDIAESCIKDLHSYGVGTKHCVFGGERLGIYFLETGAVARPSKVVYSGKTGRNGMPYILHPLEVMSKVESLPEKNLGVSLLPSARVLLMSALRLSRQLTVSV